MGEWRGFYLTIPSAISENNDNRSRFKYCFTIVLCEAGKRNLIDSFRKPVNIIHRNNVGLYDVTQRVRDGGLYTHGERRRGFN